MSEITCQNVRSILLRSQKESGFIFKPTAYGVMYSPKIVEASTISVAVFLFADFQVILVPLKQVPVLITSSSVMATISDEIVSFSVKKIFEWDDVISKAGGILSLAESIKKCQRDWTIAHAIDELVFSDSIFQFMNNLISVVKPISKEETKEIKEFKKIEPVQTFPSRTIPTKEIIILILSDQKPRKSSSIALAILPDVKESKNILDTVEQLLHELYKDGRVVKYRDQETEELIWRIASKSKDLETKSKVELESESKIKIDFEPYTKITDALQWLNNFKQTNPNIKIKEQIETRGEKHSPQFQVTLIVDSNFKYTSSIWSAKLKMARASAVFEMQKNQIL